MQATCWHTEACCHSVRTCALLIEVAGGLLHALYSCSHTSTGTMKGSLEILTPDFDIAL